VLLDWFGPGLSPVWEKPGEVFGIGAMADTLGQQNVFVKGRHGLMNIPGFLEPAEKLVNRYSRYLEGDDRQDWFVDTSAMIARIRDYCRTFQSGVSFGSYVKLRRERFPSETKRLAQLKEEYQEVSTTTRSTGTIRSSPVVLQEILDVIASIERVFVKEAVLASALFP
jgi:hypothetical protein